MDTRREDEFTASPKGSNNVRPTKRPRLNPDHPHDVSAIGQDNDSIVGLRREPEVDDDDEELLFPSETTKPSDLYLDTVSTFTGKNTIL